MQRQQIGAANVQGHALQAAGRRTRFLQLPSDCTVVEVLAHPINIRSTGSCALLPAARLAGRGKVEESLLVTARIAHL